MLNRPILNAVLAAARAVEPAQDILEGLGPEPMPGTAGFPIKRILAGVLVAGFLAVGFYFWWRRRKQREIRGAAAHPVPCCLPPPDVLREMADQEFYETLFNAARRAFTAHTAGVATTPRQFEQTPPACVAEGEAAAWREFCRRTELALYAGGKPEAEEREADMLTMRDLLRRSGSEDKEAWIGV